MIQSQKYLIPHSSHAKGLF